MRCGTLILAASCIVGAASGASAQTPAPEHIAFDRPEAWAMKYFTSASALNGLTAPDPLATGAVAIGFEAGWLPTLNAAQELVGFDGTTPEDLNKTHVFLRPRVAVGLPHGVAITAALEPPVRSFGVTPRLFAMAIDGPLHDAGAWRLRWRAHGQAGSVAAAVTCPSAVLAFAPGSAGNLTGCTAESADRTSLRYAGLEVEAGRTFAHRVVPHVSAGVNLLDTVFQTNAETYGEPDRTRLEARGITFATTAGVAYSATDRISVAADVFYSPLTVHRQTRTGVDPMMNVRALIMYRVRR